MNEDRVKIKRTRWRHSLGTTRGYLQAIRGHHMHLLFERRSNCKNCLSVETRDLSHVITAEFDTLAK